MRLKDHLPPILHNTIGTLLATAVLAIVGIVVASVPSIRLLLLAWATTPVPLWLPVVVALVFFAALLLTRWRASRTVSDAGFFRADDFPSDLAGRLRTARKAVFWGTAFVKFIPSLRDHLEARLKAGSHIQFLLVEPEGTALAMANFRGRIEDIPHCKADIHRSLATLSSLTKNGHLECKVVDYLAPYTMVILDDEDQDRTHMYVWLATLGVPNNQRPMFELSRVADPKWFEFFSEQFRLTWEKANPCPSLASQETPSK